LVVARLAWLYRHFATSGSFGVHNASGLIFMFQPYFVSYSSFHGSWEVRDQLPTSQRLGCTILAYKDVLQLTKQSSSQFWISDDAFFGFLHPSPLEEWEPRTSHYRNTYFHG
jgi:hypothetical protein